MLIQVQILLFTIPGIIIYYDVFGVLQNLSGKASL